MSDSQPPLPTVRIESIAAAGLFTFRSCTPWFLGRCWHLLRDLSQYVFGFSHGQACHLCKFLWRGCLPMFTLPFLNYFSNKLPNSAGAAMAQKRQICSICKSSKPKLAKHLEPTSLQKSIFCSRGVPGGSRGVPGVFPGCSRVVFFQGFHALHVPAKVC